ncbi:hypothetical protein B296_00055806 [Ensete ventricosum]|uniref:BHLH domain-containing protein n=1 Tax=Ensete ventricosum TaxID=4639 RepID=A0A426XJE9_ENSVE|nr:hypothetical protein B296_00055806 [Ensete ventricosum]
MLFIGWKDTEFGRRHGRKMSSRRSGISEAEINELVSKLQSLLPEARRRGSGSGSGRVSRRRFLFYLSCSSDVSVSLYSLLQASAAKLLKQTCNYIRSLNREVDDLSDRLSALMATMDSDSAEADIIRSLLRP